MSFADRPTSDLDAQRAGEMWQLDLPHPGVGDLTYLVGPCAARRAAVAFVNARRAAWREDRVAFLDYIDDLLPGQPGQPETCSLALTGPFRSVGETSAATLPTRRARGETVALPDDVQAFTQYFDAGHYPDLECTPGDAVGLMLDAHERFGVEI